MSLLLFVLYGVRVRPGGPCRRSRKGGQLLLKLPVAGAPGPGPLVLRPAWDRALAPVEVARAVALPPQARAAAAVVAEVAVVVTPASATVAATGRVRTPLTGPASTYVT